MSSSPAIHAQQLGKTFQLYDRPIDRLKQMLARNDKRYYREFAALHDVSFELRKGEVLGLVGRNGAGKSTLLQLICGTLSPSSGRVAVHGRIAALLELGAGFNPDFTGRENIYLNASILGLSKAEIDARYDEIVDFSGISDFIHQPVKTYSSGMYVRLAFSIATSVDPDILVIDEALSVGDGAFARKSFDRIMTLKERGATILFCSHSMYQIEALCTRAVWLEKGAVQQMGNPASVVAKYQSFLDRDAVQSSAQTRSGPAAPQGHARILGVQSRVDEVVGTSLEVRSGQQTLGVAVGFASDPELPPPVVAVTLNGPDGRILASSSTHSDGLLLARDAGGRGTATIEFPKIPLLKGEYFVWVYLLSENGIHIYDTASNVATLHFSQETLEQGLVSLAHQWQGEAGAHSAADAAGPQANMQPAAADPLDLLNAGHVRLVAGAGLLATQAEAATSYPALALRLGLQVATDDQPARCLAVPWRLDWLRREQLPALQQLAASLPGNAVPANVQEWKYRNADRLGIAAWDANQLVAFCGGAPRAVSYFGQSAQALHRMDALPEDSLQRSADYLHAVSSTLAELQIGDGKPHLLDFAVLNRDTLAQRAQPALQAEVDSLTELRWPAMSGRPGLQLFARPVGDAHAATVDRLWLEMKRSLPASIVCVRDWNFVRSRYLMHPHQPYAALLVRRRLSGAAVGLVVLRDRAGQGMELVDVVAPADCFGMLVVVARRYAGRLGRTAVFSSITTSHAHLLATPDGTVAGKMVDPPARVVVANVWSPGPTVDELRGHWWLMAGDTDFS